MEENDKKNLRVFYLTLAVILTVVAVLVIAITVARRSTSDIDGTGTPSGGSTLNPDVNTGLDNETELPVFKLPLKDCVIDVDFSDTVPVFSQTMNDYRTHLGEDIGANLGDEVTAVADGVVTNVWKDPFMGTCVSIEHSGNAVSYYKNLSPEVQAGIVIGASVKAGDVIGAVGESAMNEVAQEPHLHFEMKVNNKHVNPREHIKFPSQSQNEENKTEDNTEGSNN
ncbi:MAG: M23 family metallopeptidase [Clostridia bacterium]|nr:M23 family metallopeptidase [Clostridia bacterium]